MEEAIQELSAVPGTLGTARNWAVSVRQRWKCSTWKKSTPVQDSSGDRLEEAIQELSAVPGTLGTARNWAVSVRQRWKISFSRRPCLQNHWQQINATGVLDAGATEVLDAGATEVLNQSMQTATREMAQREVDESHGMFRIEKYELHIHTNEVV